MLMANICSCWLVATYLYMNDAYAGAAVWSIAGLASFSIIIVDMLGLPNAKILRNSIATVFACLAVSILYSKPSDLLPCLAFVQNRFLEARGTEQAVRWGVFIGTSLWAAYAVSHGLYLLAAIEMSVCAYAGYSLYRHSQHRLLQVAPSKIPKPSGFF